LRLPVDGEEGSRGAGEDMDLVHVLACVVDFPRGVLRGSREALSVCHLTLDMEQEL